MSNGFRVIIIAGLSADGFIARTSNELADWTSKEDKRNFVQLTKETGVMVMGANTYKTIGRPLPGRRNIIYSHQTIVQDGIETTQEPPKQLVARLKREGCAGLAVCGGQAIYDMFLRAGLVSELHLTIEPVLFGRGLTLGDSLLETHLNLKSVKQLNSDTLNIIYEVK